VKPRESHDAGERDHVLIPRRVLLLFVLIEQPIAPELELPLESWLEMVTMSHHLFLLSPSDTPLYSLTHQSNRPAPMATSPLAANLPTWSTSAFAGTLTALSGASSAPQRTSDGVVRGGGQDRHVIQMIANASLDAVEDIMRKENTM
jgi:hypothetical protein